MGKRLGRVLQRYVKCTTPDSLAAIRVLTCVVLLASTVWEDLASSALLPSSMRQPMGFLELFYVLPGFEAFVQSQAALGAFEWFTICVLVLGCVGCFTRVTLPLGVLCYFLLAGILRQYAWFYHTGLIPLYMLAALSFTPCADAWSVDRLRWAARGRALPDVRRPASVYGLSRHLCYLVLAVPYCAAGLSKIRNGGLLQWWHPTAMRGILYTDSLNPMQFDFGWALPFPSAPDAIFSFLGIFTIVGEIGYISVLFSPAARRVMPAVMLLMHIGILFLQNILFFDLILLQLMFVDVRPVGAALRPLFGGRFPPAASASPKPADQLSAGVVLSGRPEVRIGVAALGLVILLLTCWILRIERFPLTGMQMYSRPARSGISTYVQVWAYTTAGDTIRPPFEETIPAIATIDSRYRLVLAGAFRASEEGRRMGEEVCRDFLTRVADLYNPTVRREARITRFEVEQWKWDFERNPRDSRHGQVVDRFVVDMVP